MKGPGNLSVTLESRHLNKYLTKTGQSVYATEICSYLLQNCAKNCAADIMNEFFWYKKCDTQF